MNRLKCDDLLIGTILITKNKFKWRKIGYRKWVCTGTSNEDTWAVGSIYEDNERDTLREDDTIIPPFNYYYEQLERYIGS